VTFCPGGVWVVLRAVVCQFTSFIRVIKAHSIPELPYDPEPTVILHVTLS